MSEKIEELTLTKGQLQDIMVEYNLDDKQLAKLCYVTERAARGWRLGERPMKGANVAILWHRLGIKTI